MSNLNYEKTQPFWYRNKRGNIAIQERLLIEFLENVGFAKFYTDKAMTSKPIILKKSENIIEEIIPLRVHEFIVNLLSSNEFPDALLKKEDQDALISELTKTRILLKEDFLILLSELDKPILVDSRDSAYFPFNNCIVVVTANEIESIPHGGVDKYIWKNQIIDRNFKLLDEDLQKGVTDYYRFLRNISSTWINNKWVYSDERYDALMSLHGYLLHNFKDSSNQRAVILMDASENGEANGRTGKGLLVKGMSKIRKVVTEDGKSFDDKNRFNYSNVTIDTNILFLDDVKERFNFENFFSVISEGISVEPKFINKVRIPYEKSPKVVISTNYALAGRGSSHEARKYEYELTNYYNDERTPLKEFKHSFFNDWDEFQWMAFDSLMMDTVKRYLKNGVVLSKPIRKDQKKLSVETSHLFAEWKSSNELKNNIRLSKIELFKDYRDFCEGEPDCDVRLFVKWLKIYAGYKGLITEESHSGNIRYIEFKPL